MTIKKTALLFTCLFLIAGCSQNTKKKLGLTETMPDEYKVQRNKSLEIPPSYKQKQAPNTKQTSKFSKAEQALLKEAK